MFPSRLTSTTLRNTLRNKSFLATTTSTSIPRTFTTSTRFFAKDDKMSTEPPKHEMKYFEGLTSKVRAFGQFRKVIHTGLYSQLVTMEIPVGGDIGNEVHLVDQVLIFTSGTGKAVIAGKEQNVKASDVVVVPAGTEHQFYNTSKDQPLELVTVYSPAEHDPRTVHKTKEEGDEEEDAGKDEAPEWSQQSKDTNEKKGLAKEEGGPYENGDDGRHGRKVE
ncbi:RmlC-like cupin [Aureobasidium subglaciale]|nr:RmlC-like cupin [Aureobasidium subglaciale]KAI5232609.1 RmlC-like cupin [Aureobasidium subglaciale]KAI5234796.1 RmlC-like cupin [Aureobasidium subglaciale]KAI5252552.1 RmlC-like cupin [Aureobasidium subglaciale]KAI5268234.1 RmlC-like cupin [Aureobasidium subglaciale]